MAKRVDELLVRQRVALGGDLSWEMFRRSLKGLERYLAGDWSDLGVMPRQEVTSQRDGEDGKAANDDDPERDPIQLTHAVQGRMNHLQRAVHNIVMGLANNAPRAEFEGVEADHALFHQLYFQRRLGPRPFGCNFADTQQSLIYDACLSLGWAAITFQAGVPAITRIDPLKVHWDKTQGTPGRAKWVCFRSMERASHWKEMFGGTAFDDHLASGVDEPVDVWFYYDVTDPVRGVYRAFMASRGDRGELREVDRADGDEYPFLAVEMVNGERYTTPYLPAEALYFSVLPGSPYPSSIVHAMLPHQIAILEANKRQLVAVRNGPKTVANLKVLSQKDRDILMKSGQLPDMLLYDHETINPETVIHMEQGADISPAVEAYKADHERLLTAMSGEDPFTGGASNDRNYTLATNVAAVQQASRVTTDYRGERVANFFSNLLQKYLWACYEYDASPVAIDYEGVRMEFTAEDRVGSFLNPSARVIVRKDMHMYAPQAERIARAEQLLAMGAQLGNPAWVEAASSEVLKAQGVSDPQSWMAAPEGPASVMDQQSAGA